jgi:CRP/FNR family transcriptional regulator, cyclic AMP receptor protein
MSETTFDVEAIAAAESKVLVFGDGASIYRRHERGDCAYIIGRGQIEISQRGRAVEIMQPGEIIGEIALIDNEPRTASAVALGEVELIPIDRPLFAVLVRDDPDFAKTIIHLLARRLRAAMNLLERQGDWPARHEAADTRAA